MRDRSTSPRRLRTRQGLAVVVVGLVATTGLVAEPHPHRGTLSPYDAKPAKLELSTAEISRLERGENVLRQSEAGLGGRGVAVQDIAAPSDVVWDRILDFPAYPKMIENVKEIEVYAREKERVKVRFVIGQFGLKLEYFIDHVVKRDDGFMTWTLDYDKKSELDDSVGYWFVEPHPTTPDTTRLYYSVDVRMKGWVPGFVQDMVREEGLVRATRWVKLHSERVFLDKKAREKPKGATPTTGGAP